MTLEQLEAQVLLWTRAAIVVPIFFTGLLMLAYTFGISSLRELFFIACGLYFTTAVIWWWWTMKSVQLLVRILSKANANVESVAEELISIRKELQVDNGTNK